MTAAFLLPLAGWCATDSRVVPIWEDSPTPTSIDLMEVVVVGNTVLDTQTIQTVVEPHLGPGRTLDDVDQIRVALEEAYRERGYKTVAVRVPKQTSRDGVVRLDVQEGRIGRLTVTGSRFHSLERVKSLAPSVAPGTVPDFDALQGDLIGLNSLQDLRVTPALKQGARPQTLDLDLAVDDSLPLHVTFEVNNRHGQDTEPLRFQESVSYTNLWQRGHSLSLTYQEAPQDRQQSQVFFASYLARFDGSPASVLFNYIKSDSNISTVGGINVLGAGEIFGLRVFMPLEAGGSLFPTMSVGMDYKSFSNMTALPDTGQGEKTFETPVTYVPVSLAFSLLSRDTRSSTQADISLNVSSPQLGSESSELDNNRYGARGQQFSVRGSVNRTQELLLSMQAALRASMQTTDQPLISSEQFSAGGADTVRGYLESAALGDTGAVWSFELRTAPLVGFGDLRAFAFTDGAELRVLEALPDQTTEYKLASWGYGIRFNVGSVLDAVAQWAVPLLDLPEKEPETGRLLFRLTATF